MPTHFHWIVWAFRDYDPQSGNYIDITNIDVIAEDHEKAISKAKTLIPKELKGGGDKVDYRIQQVVEHFDGACR